MNKNRITLSQATKFHGHLGPYLILGILAGEFAVKKLKCKRYFGLNVKVYGANEKPKSCLIDGIQLSTGATFGKGNIQKFNGSIIRIQFYNHLSRKRISLKLKAGLRQILEVTKTHQGSEALAKELYKTNYCKLFDLTPNTEE